MTIRKYVHDRRNDRNRRLFAMIGGYCACEATREALGIAISSRPGQVWFVAVKGRTVLAFGSIRIQGEQALLRHLHSPAGDAEAWKAVLHDCIEHARSSRVRAVSLTDYLNMAGDYAPFGFIPQGRPKGRFTLYTLELESSHGSPAMD